MAKKINISRWFNIEDIDHLRAWNHLSITGHWPEGFIPKYVVMDMLWQVCIASKMADTYVKEKLKDAK